MNFGVKEPILFLGAETKNAFQIAFELQEFLRVLLLFICSSINLLLSSYCTVVCFRRK